MALDGGGGRKMYRVLLGKPKGKRPLGRPGYGWDYNVKLDLEEIDKVWTGFFHLRMGVSGRLL